MILFTFLLNLELNFMTEIYMAQWIEAMDKGK